MAQGKTRLFVRQFIARPGKTGAIIPSSGMLARRMLELAAPGDNAVIVEYGPGTGVFTAHIRASLKPGQRFFAIEVNEHLARRLRGDYPDLSLHVGCASRVGEYLAAEGLEHVDSVISGLPWAVFSADLQKRILGGMAAVMPPGGVFVTFAYLQGLVMPSGRKFKRSLGRYFSRIERSEVIWRNVPPALIYRCVR